MKLLTIGLILLTLFSVIVVANDYDEELTYVEDTEGQGEDEVPINNNDSEVPPVWISQSLIAQASYEDVITYVVSSLYYKNHYSDELGTHYLFNWGDLTPYNNGYYYTQTNFILSIDKEITDYCYKQYSEQSCFEALVLYHEAYNFTTNDNQTFLIEPIYYQLIQKALKQIEKIDSYRTKIIDSTLEDQGEPIKTITI